MHAIAMVHKMQRLALSGSNYPAIQEEEIDPDAATNNPSTVAAVDTKTSPEQAVDMDLSLPQ